MLKEKEREEEDTHCRKADFFNRLPRFIPLNSFPRIFHTHESGRGSSSTTRVYRMDLSSCRVIRWIISSFKVHTIILRDQYRRNTSRPQSISRRRLASQRRKWSVEELRRPIDVMPNVKKVTSRAMHTATYRASLKCFSASRSLSASVPIFEVAEGGRYWPCRH